MVYRLTIVCWAHCLRSCTESCYTFIQLRV